MERREVVSETGQDLDVYLRALAVVATRRARAMSGGVDREATEPMFWRISHEFSGTIVAVWAGLSEAEHVDIHATLAQRHPSKNNYTVESGSVAGEPDGVK